MARCHSSLSAGRTPARSVCTTRTTARACPLSWCTATWPSAIRGRSRRPLSFLPRAQGNPRGIDRRAFDKFTRDLLAGRPAAVKAFVDSCYNLDQFGGTRVSDQAWQNAFYAAVGTALPAAVGCVAAGQEDFRADLTQITVPVLVKQGSEDQAAAAWGDRQPPAGTARRCPARPNPRRPARDHLDARI